MAVVSGKFKLRLLEGPNNAASPGISEGFLYLEWTDNLISKLGEDGPIIERQPERRKRKEKEASNENESGPIQIKSFSYLHTDS